MILIQIEINFHKTICTNDVSLYQQSSRCTWSPNDEDGWIYRDGYIETAGYIESSGSLTTWCIWLSSNPLFWLLQVTAKLNLLFEIFISFKIFLPVRGYYYSRCTVVYSVTGPQRVVFLLLLHYLQIKKRLFQINC